MSKNKRNLILSRATVKGVVLFFGVGTYMNELIQSSNKTAPGETLGLFIF